MAIFTSLRRVFVLVCFAVFAASCGQPVSNTSTDPKMGQKVAGTRGGTVSYRISAPPSTFNYLVATDEPSLLTSFYLINSRPIEFDHPTQGHRAVLAETWTFQPDRRTVDLKLREGIKFSDGHPITTADVAFSLAAMYDPRTEAASWSDSMSVNGKPIETKIIDERNLQFIFPEPVAAVENYID